MTFTTLNILARELLLTKMTTILKTGWWRALAPPSEVNLNESFPVLSLLGHSLMVKQTPYKRQTQAQFLMPLLSLSYSRIQVISVQLHESAILSRSTIYGPIIDSDGALDVTLLRDSLGKLQTNLNHNSEPESNVRCRLKAEEGPLARVAPLVLRMLRPVRGEYQLSLLNKIGETNGV